MLVAIIFYASINFVKSYTSAIMNGAHWRLLLYIDHYTLNTESWTFEKILEYKMERINVRQALIDNGIDNYEEFLQHWKI